VRGHGAPTPVLLAAALLAPLAGSGRERAPAVVEDAVSVQVVGREVWALLDRGGPLRERLEKDETVVWSGSRGEVGSVLTSRRWLAVAPGSSGWQELRRRLGETPADDPGLSARVALWITDQRAVVFDAVTGGFVEEGIGPHEQLRDHDSGQEVAVVVTDRRGLAYAAGGRRFVEIDLRIEESFQGVSALAELVTLRTSQRLLVFRTSSASWGEESLPLD